MWIANLVSYILVLTGALNWGLFGLLDFNLVAWVCGGARTGWAVLIYSLIALAAVWLIVSPIISRGRLPLKNKDKEE